MDFKRKVIEFSLDHYKLVTWVMVIFTLVCAAFIPLIKVDTDPENMLSEHMGDNYPNLPRTDQAGLRPQRHRGRRGNQQQGPQRRVQSPFAATDLRADAVRQDAAMARSQGPRRNDRRGRGGPTGSFDGGPHQPGRSRRDPIRVADAPAAGRPPPRRSPSATRRLSNPLLKDTVVSGDGKAITLYLPLTSKDLSHRVYALRKQIATFTGDEEYHITGLPVAEDTFGYEMFIQMAISAPWRWRRSLFSC